MSALLLVFALHLVAPANGKVPSWVPCDGHTAGQVRALTPPVSPAPLRPIVAPRRGARVLAVGPAMDGT